MKSNRLNLCVTLRNTLLNSGYSTVKAVNAVNAALGDLTIAGSEDKVKMGDGKLTKTAYKVSEVTTTTDKYTGSLGNIALRFDAFNAALSKVEKIAEVESITLPEIFVDWLNKFAKAEKSAEQLTGA